MPRDRSMILSDVRGPTLAIMQAVRTALRPRLTRESLGKIGATYVLFPGVNCRKHLASAARLITECRACTPGCRVIDPCSMDVQPCSIHCDARIRVPRH